MGDLADQARSRRSPALPPHPGEPVYEIVVDGRAVQIADGDLLGPLRELTIGVLTEGWQII